VSCPNRAVICCVTQCVLTDQFVDLIARPAPRIRQPLNQRPLCQRGQDTLIGAGNCLGRFSGKTADKDRQRAQRRTLPRAKPAPGTVQDHRKAAMTFLDERRVRGQGALGLREMIEQVMR
jgi:hypothetical protein